MSTEPKFTPGPYRCEGPDPFGDWNILHPGDALAVAAVVSNMREPEEVAANAHLQAAAPELYDALKRILPPDMRATIAKHHASDCGCNYCFASAALSKAEGRS